MAKSACKDTEGRISKASEGWRTSAKTWRRNGEKMRMLELMLTTIPSLVCTCTRSSANAKVSKGEAVRSYS